jgi:hypothetical protein
MKHHPQACACMPMNLQGESVSPFLSTAARGALTKKKGIKTLDAALTH